MRALIAAFLLATPAAAFEPMTLNDCRNGWIAATDALSVAVRLDGEDAVDAMRDEALLVQQSVTDDGWCRLTGESPGLEGADFDTLDWQAEGLDRFIKDGAPPLAVRVRVTEVQNDRQTRPAFDLAASLRQIPGDGLLLIEEFRMSDADGDWLALTALLQGAFWDTAASAQSSMGGITLSSAEARLNLTPERIAVNGTEPGDYLGDFHEVVVDALDGLDDSQLDDDSRAALTALLADLPDANGTLDIGLRSANGLGWMQVVMAQTFNPDATNAEILGFALSGIDVDVGWRPFE